MSESVAGKIMAAPRPMTALAAISSPGLAANAPAALATPNVASPASRAPLRPQRSERLPEVRTRAANTRL